MKASKVLQGCVSVLLILSCIISCIAVSMQTANAAKLGDINSDGNVNSTDLTLLKRYILHRIPSFPGETAKPTPTPTSITPSPSDDLNIPWDWSGVIGTGQSLAVGSNPILSSNQPYNRFPGCLPLGVTAPCIFSRTFT